MSFLLIVGPKSTLASSHAAPWWVCWRDRQTDGRQTVTLRFSLDEASVMGTHVMCLILIYVFRPLLVRFGN